MDNIKISVIIPSIDRKTFVLDLIEDLNKQKIKPYEIIVIDQSRDPYLLDSSLYYHIEAKGPCDARNFGFEKSSGDIAVFLDDDIRIEDDFLNELCGPIIDKKYRAVTGAMCDANGKYIISSAGGWSKRNVYPWILALTASPGHPGSGTTISMTTCCCAIERSLLNQVGLFDPFFDPNGAGEDREMALRIFSAGYPILYNGAARAFHLSASRGGRKSVVKLKLNPLEANSIYIVHKYFGEKVFDEYCKNWLRYILRKNLTLNPISWIGTWKYYRLAQNHIATIAKLKT